MKKRVLSLFLVLVMVLGLLPTAALAASEPEARYQTEPDGEWITGTLAEAIANVYDAGRVEVLRDILLEEPLTIEKPLTLTSAEAENPCTIRYAAPDRASYLLTIRANATLENIILDGGRENGLTARAELMGVRSTTQVILGDGAVLQNNDNVDGGESAGGLRVMNSQVVMQKGSVIRNCRGRVGGGVGVRSGNLVLNGGVVENCQAHIGGGIHLNDESQNPPANANIYDGSAVRNNVALKEWEGSPNLSQYANWGSGGGIAVEHGYLNLWGGVDVSGNQAQSAGGGIYVENGRLVLANGSITNNVAGSYGGGVYAKAVSRGTYTVLAFGPQVTGNTGGEREEGVFDNLHLDVDEDTDKDPTLPITIQQPLRDNASIGISSLLLPDKDHPFRVVAKPYKYTITESDLKKFHSDDPRYVVLLHNKNLVLANANVLFDNQSHGDITPPGQRIDEGYKVTDPGDLEEKGYDFGGWYKEAACETRWNFEADTVMGYTEEPLTLYAKWTAHPYSITYNLDGGENAADNPDEYTIESETLTLASPVKEGYTFLGWTEDGEETPSLEQTIHQGSMGDRVYTAQWAVNTYPVTFDVQGHGAAPKGQTVSLGGKVSSPTAPTEPGYDFGGWFKESACETPWDFDTDTVTAAVTLYAKWTVHPYSITYNLDGGENAADNPDEYTIESETLTLASPVKEGYTFLGWTEDGEETPSLEQTIPQGSMGDRVYTAQWAVNTYPVTFDVQGHGAAPDEQSVNWNEKVSAPTAPEESGWKFDGWYKEATCETAWDFEADAVTEAVTLYAKWIKEASPRPSRPSRPGPPEEQNFSDTPVPMAPLLALEREEHFAYIVGCDDGTVRPEGHITRAEAATIFFRLMTEDFRTAHWSVENPFPDVGAEKWYHNAVSTDFQAGLILGLPDGTFGGERDMTRAEFAALAARFLSDADAPDSGFADLDGHWAKAEVDRAVAAGWIKGCDDGLFHPDEPISRAQVMTLVNRMLGRLPAAAGLTEDMLCWPDNPADKWYYLDVQEATNGHTYDRSDTGAELWRALTENRDWTALER